jgi:hypothetical protein
LWEDFRKYPPVGSNVSRLSTPIPFPYFGSVAKTIYAYGNGYVSFDADYQQTTAPPQTSWTFAPNLFAVYWADIEYPQNNASYFYTYEDDKRLKKVEEESSLIEYVRTVVNNSDFQPLYAVAVTWVNAVPRPALTYPNDAATFQLILATDSKVSFAIQSYHKVWENTEVADRPHYTAAHTTGDGGRSDTSVPVIEDPKVIKLGDENPSNESLNCVRQTQDVKLSLDELIKSLPPCPCQKVQAANDPRFVEIDSCYQRENSEGDTLQQRCCFNEYGLLITNSKAAQVPAPDESLQKAHDQCCQDESRLCDWFYEQIPSSNCSAYKPPAFIGAGFGDPHLWTFDGNRYSFNILGDFVLFKSGDSNVEIQVRTGLSSNNKGTIFIAYAVRDVKNNITHEFTINSTGKFLKDYKAPELTRSSIRTSGFTIIIQNNDGALYHTIIADELEPGSVGLMGSLDGDPSNDFKPFKLSVLNGTAIQLTGEQIQEFVLSWNVTGNPLISAPPTHTGQPDPAILPTTLQGTQDLFGNDTLKEVASDICVDNIFCLQEYYFSKNNDSARRVLKQDEAIVSQRELSSKVPPSFTNTETVIAVNVASALNLKLTAAAKDQNVTFHVSSIFNNNSGFKLYKDTLDWNVNAGLDALRHLSYPQKLTFFVVNADNMSAEFTPTINLCLCQKAEECQNANTGNPGFVNSLLCNCTGNGGGRFCQEKLELCKNCFNVSACNHNVTEDYCSACPQGYRGDGLLCYDVDECSNNKNGCAFGCENTDGSSFCFCQPGYRVEGKACTEINECEDNYNYCNSSVKVCQNTKGSASCSCMPGLVGDEECIRAPYAFIGEIRFSISPSELNYSTLLIKGTEEFQEMKNIFFYAITQSLRSLGPNSFVEIVQFLDFNNDTVEATNTTEAVLKETMTARFIFYTSDISVTAARVQDALKTLSLNCSSPCRFGILSKTSEPATVDPGADLCSYSEINKCDESTTKCHFQNYTTHCTCLDGYEYFPQSLYACKDINECSNTKTLTNCSDAASCINTDGGYQCKCAKGKVWNVSSRTCVGDKCSNKPCQNDGVCLTLFGNEGYGCSCTYGWTGTDCSEEDTDARRWKIAVITVSAILGFSCLALFIIVIVVCVKQKSKQTTSASSSHYAEIKPMPRARVSQRLSTEMEEKNSTGNVYAPLQSDSAHDKNSSLYSSASENRSNGTRAVYNNAAFESDIVARL